MTGFGRWAWGHLMLAFPTILVIAILKFIFEHNTYLAGFRNDF